MKANGGTVRISTTGIGSTRERKVRLKGDQPAVTPVIFEVTNKHRLHVASLRMPPLFSGERTRSRRPQLSELDTSGIHGSLVLSWIATSSLELREEIR